MMKKRIIRARKIVAEIVEVWDGMEVDYYVVKEIEKGFFKKFVIGRDEEEKDRLERGYKSGRIGLEDCIKKVMKETSY